VIRIVLSSEAEADALDAFRFYEARRDGLGPVSGCGRKLTAVRWSGDKVERVA
jgi:hypothetical protein